MLSSKKKTLNLTANKLSGFTKAILPAFLFSLVSGCLCCVSWITKRANLYSCNENFTDHYFFYFFSNCLMLTWHKAAGLCDAGELEEG